MTNKTLFISLTAVAVLLLGYLYLFPSKATAETGTQAHITESHGASPDAITPTQATTTDSVTTAGAANTTPSSPAALKTFDQFTPIERERLRLDFEAMSEPDRLFAVISAEDEAWKKENFFPDKNFIEKSDDATLERLAFERPIDKTALNAIIYKWWLRKDPRWKEVAQDASYTGSSFAARLLLNEELNTFGKRPDVEEAFRLHTIIILSGDNSSHRFLMQDPGIFTRFSGDDALSTLNSCLFTMNAAQKIDIKTGRPVYTRRPRPRVPWMKAY
jgi:hypothetical protein